MEQKQQFGFMICDNIGISSNGHLTFGGRDTIELLKKYGSPLFLMDEKKLRSNCRTYVNAMRECFGPDGAALYASKAASFKRIYEIIAEEGMGCDVVSSGEIYTARAAGFPLERAYFHSNNKTDADIKYAIECGVGRFVVDNAEELYAINEFAGAAGITQSVLLRITPGIDPHTYAAVATGKVDSKFGSAIETGQAEEMVRLALSLPNIDLAGFHCHVGSQVFDSDVFIRSSEIMLEFIGDMAEKYSFVTDELDLGGGYGVRYTENDPTIDISKNIREVANKIKASVKSLGIKMPKIRLEPGRSIVADTMLTLYTVGTVKTIPGYKNYVSVDGGMTDNPRFALYGSKYTMLLANKANERAGFSCSVVGRCCESGDILGENIMLPTSVTRGDILAVLTTGAYNYSMSSNYNRIARPPIAVINGNEDYLAVRRESLEDIIRNDV